MATAPVAYEASVGDCGCQRAVSPAEWDRKVEELFRAMGSTDPLGDMQAASVYLAHAKAAGVEPGIAAAVAYATVHHAHPVVSVGVAPAGVATEKPRARETKASDYFSVHHGGKKIRFKDYDAAKKDANAHGGYVEFAAGEHKGERVPDDLPEGEREPETRADLSRIVVRALVSHADVRAAPWRVTLLSHTGSEIAEATGEIVVEAFDKASSQARKAGYAVPVYLQNGFREKYSALPPAKMMHGSYFGQWPAEGLDEAAAEEASRRKPRMTISGRREDGEQVFWAKKTGWTPDFAEAWPMTEKTWAKQIILAERAARQASIRSVTTNETVQWLSEDCVGVHTHTPVANPEVVVVAGAANESGPEYAGESRPSVSGKPRKLHWHRGDEDGSYHAEGHLGRYDLSKRAPDRRHGVLPVVLKLNDREIGQFDSKTDAQEMAAAYDMVIPYAAPGETDVRIEDGKALVKGARVIDGCLPWVRVTKDPERFSACLTRARELGPIDAGEKVYELLAPYMARQDQEIFVVVLLDVQDHVRGVAEVARGQRSKVFVDPADILRPVLITGASRFWVAHDHPSGKAEPSGADRRLTKAIEKATKAAAPDVEFEGHIVVGDGEWGDASSGKVHKVK